MMQGELPALTCAQVREVDRRAIAELGIPGMVLMENASRALAGAVHAMRGNSNAPVAILCGGGNNGGDGYALARLLACEGVPSILFAAKDPGELTGDAGRQVHIVRCLGMTIHELAAPDSPARLGACSLWVDALLGTGFHGRIEGALQQAMAPLSALRSAAGAQVLAVDLPSGLDADSGSVDPRALRADRTVTFVARKVGFRSSEATGFLGQVQVASIGVPGDWVRQILGLGA